MRAILLIDDDQDFGELVVRALRDDPFELTVCLTRESGLDWIRTQAKQAQNIALVLLDVRCVGMSLEEFHSQLSSFCPELIDQNKVVVISSYPGDSPEIEKVKLLFDRYIEKPMDLAVFRDDLMRLISL